MKKLIPLMALLVMGSSFSSPALAGGGKCEGNKDECCKEGKEKCEKGKQEKASGTQKDGKAAKETKDTSKPAETK